MCDKFDNNNHRRTIDPNYSDKLENSSNSQNPFEMRIDNNENYREIGYLQQGTQWLISDLKITNNVRM